MNYLLSQIFLCLLAAFILGAIIGWLWRNYSTQIELNKLKKRFENCKKDFEGYKTLKEKVKVKSEKSQATPLTDTIDETIDHENGIPAFLHSPRGGKADDLKRIKGIGKVLEGILFEQGIFHFEQIASWSDENAKWMDTFMKFPGRIEREKWVEQAALLAKGLETDFSKKVDKNKIYD